jgi:hypothetical protein
MSLMFSIVPKNVEIVRHELKSIDILKKVNKNKIVFKTFQSSLSKCLWNTKYPLYAVDLISMVWNLFEKWKT